MVRSAFYFASVPGRLAAVLLASLLSLALAQGEEGFSLTEAGFAGPESMYWHEEADVYLVSNINGSPAEADGNGFISRVDPSGEVSELRWIDGEADGTELDAPKGMAVVNGTLYVADINFVRMFDAQTGEQTGSVEIEGSDFLNDVAAAPGGGALVTDTGVGADFQPTGNAAVHRVNEDGSTEVVSSAEELTMVNGVATTEDGRIVVVTLANPGQILFLDEGGGISETIDLEAGSLDGVVPMPGGDLLVSTWSESAVIRVSQDGSVSTVADGLESPADIGFDSQRQLVLVPLLNVGEVHVVPLEQ